MLAAPAATSNARRRRWVQGRLPPVLPRLGRNPTASTDRAPPRRTFCLWPFARPDEGSCPAPVLSAQPASFELDPWPQLSCWSAASRRGYWRVRPLSAQQIDLESKGQVSPKPLIGWHVQIVVTPDDANISFGLVKT